MCTGLHVHYPLFLSDFNETLTFSTDFRKVLKNIKFHKNQSVETELFHADRRTDMTKLVAVFSSFANAPKNRPFSACPSFYIF